MSTYRKRIQVPITEAELKLLVMAGNQDCREWRDEAHFIIRDYLEKRFSDLQQTPDMSSVVESVLAKESQP